LIVISGALAVVAFVLLIAGLVSDGLGLVYASIAVSLVSAIFLGVGAFQRRGEEVAPARAEPASTPGFASEPVRVGAGADDGVAAEESTVRIAAASDAPSGGTVYVVPGRPRYHVADCRYLTGKDGEQRSLAEARNEGYTACGICRPDENVSAAPELAFVGATADDDDAGLDDGTDDFADVKPAATRRTAAAGRGTRASARKTTARRTAAKKSTAKKTTARSAPAKKSTAKKTTARSAPAKKSTAKKTTARSAPAKKSTAKKTTAKKTTARSAPAKKSTAKQTAAKKTAKKAAKRSTRR
jgi:hypothetical protein